MGRRFDPETHSLAHDAIDRDHDPIADDQLFANFATEH
jgi:hypothetical protein